MRNAIGRLNCGRCAESKNWDFMSVMACIPFPMLSWGFDTSVAPYLVYPTPDGGIPATWFENYLPPTKPNPQLRPMGFYCGYTDTWVFSDGFTSQTVTTVFKRHHFYRNPADLEQFALTGTPANDTDGNNDVRLTGWPWDCDETTVTTITGDTSLVAIADPIIRDQYYHQQDVPPPSFTESSVTQTFPGPGNPAEPTHNAIPISYSRVLTDYISWKDWQAKVDALLALVPLSPRHLVASREGEIYFDYQRTTAIYADQANLIAPGAYDGSGLGTWINPPTGKILGVQIGANETGVGYDNVLLGTGSWDNMVKAGRGRNVGWPYLWHSGQSITGLTYDPIAFTYTNNVDPTEITGGLSGFDSSATLTPDCFNIVVRPGVTSITFQNGVPGAAHTLYVTAAHTNHVVIFPLRSGPVITISNAIKPFIFADCWTQMLSYNDGFHTVFPAWGPILFGYCKAKSLVRVPQVEPGTDPCGFSRMGIPNTPPLRRLHTLGYTLIEPPTGLWFFFKDLEGGEYVFEPNDVRSSSGCVYGFGEFGDLVTASPPPGAGSTQVGAAGSGTNQAAGGGDDSGV